jgi:hypothetical protein
MPGSCPIIQNLKSSGYTPLERGGGDGYNDEVSQEDLDSLLITQEESNYCN